MLKIMTQENSSNEGTSELAGWPGIPNDAAMVLISPYLADGYRWTPTGWDPINEFPRGALRLDSGDHELKNSKNGEPIWLIAGRSDKNLVALAKFQHQRFQHQFASISVEDFLRYNPEYLVGQTLQIDGENGQVIEQDHDKVKLAIGFKKVELSIDQFLAEHVNQILERTVLLVDKG